MKNLSPFGDIQESDDEIDLSCLISHLERMIHFEEDKPMSRNGPLYKRLQKAEDTLALLYEVYEL